MKEKGIRRLKNGSVEIEVRFLKPGTILAWPTFDKNNEMVFPSYRPFTKEDIDTLLKNGNNFLYYTQQANVRLQYEKDLKSYLDKEVYKGPRTIAVETQKRAVSAMKEIVQFIKAGKVSDFLDAKNIVEYVLNDIHTSKSELVNLLDIQDFDDYTYTHSLNVGVISMVLAKRMKLSDELMFKIGMGGFLHDIGKLKVPNEVLNKPTKLTEEEFEEIKRHPRYGYEMVRNSSNISDTVQKLILLHHEWADGTGYPLHLTHEKLGNLVFIISIADFYDALTTARPYKRALSAPEALRIVMQHSISHFPEKIVRRFMMDMKDILKESCFFEIGMYVLLNTKEVARVIEKDTITTNRPVVEILKNSRGKINIKPVRVDLNYDGSRSIIKIYKPEEIENLHILFS